MIRRANFLVEVFIEPLPGFEMSRVGGEYLIVNQADSTNNTLLDSDLIASILEDRMRDDPPTSWDEFRQGHGKMWQVVAITRMEVD